MISDFQTSVKNRLQDQPFDGEEEVDDLFLERTVEIQRSQGDWGIGIPSTPLS
jgi:hypothetical protein